MVSDQKKADNWLLEASVLPTVMPDSHEWWNPYLAHQRMLSKKLAGGRPPADSDERVEQFARITRINTAIAPDDQKKFLAFLNEALSYRREHDKELRTWDSFLTSRKDNLVKMGFLEDSKGGGGSGGSG